MAVNSINTIKQVARKYNREFFAGQLKISDIEFSLSNHMISTLGQYSIRGGKQYLKISALLAKSSSEWKATLCHELVHAWQYQTGEVLGHGYSFKHKAALIGRIDSTMVITRTRNSEYINKAVAEKRGATSQYMLIKDGKVNFLRKMTEYQITRTKRRGYEVRLSTSPLHVKHVRNYDTFRDGPRSYYPLQRISKVEEFKTFKTI